MSIIASSKGVTVEFLLRDNGAIIPLFNSTVTIVIKRGTHRVEKTATITDQTNGICEFITLETDFPKEGSYEVQGIIKVSGKEIPSDETTIEVGKRI